MCCVVGCFFFQAEDGIRDLVRSRGLGDVYKRQGFGTNSGEFGIKYFKDGVLSDLYVSCLNQVDQFLVTPDGHVFISSTNGYTVCDEPYEGEFFRRINPDAVSYTHLTLPTSDQV